MSIYTWKKLLRLVQNYWYTIIEKKTKYIEIGNTGTPTHGKDDFQYAIIKLAILEQGSHYMGLKIFNFYQKKSNQDLKFIKLKTC